MKALSIRQPWAEPIVDGRKRYDLRKWKPGMRGRVAIHAAKTVEKRGQALSTAAECDISGYCQ